MFFLKAALLVFRSTCRGKRPARKTRSRMLKQCLFPFIARQGGGLFTLMTHNEANRQFYRKNGWMEFDERVLRGKEMSLESWSYKTVIK